LALIYKRLDMSRSRVLLARTAALVLIRAPGVIGALPRIHRDRCR
jgi:hypothetical protein